VGGFLGIGGGIVLVPILVGLMGLTQHHAHGISLSVIVPIALTGTIVYAVRGDIDWALVAAIGAGSIAGVIAGAKLMVKVSAHRLRQGFGAYTIAVAIVLLVR
jgi:uncharacterized membrane protein YfcA